MKNSMHILLGFFLFIMPLLVNAQDITGMWKVEKVQVGAEEMTPVDKWTSFTKDGVYLSGNGWLQHTKGRWSYDKKAKQLLLEETNGIVDPFGAFTVVHSPNGMSWTREEEGMEVIVHLHRIDEMPRTLADEIKGLWSLVKVEKEGNDVSETYAVADNEYIMFRWDRRFVEQFANGEKNYAYWYIHPHKPELRLIDRTKETVSERWHIEINANTMELRGIKGPNKGVTFVYQRLHEFPE